MNLSFLLAAAGLFLLTNTSVMAADTPEDKPAVSVLVKIQLARQSSVDQTVAGYGNVTTDVSHTRNVSAPLPGLVSSLRVGIGQAVSKHQPLLELTVDPNARTAYRQAASALANAKEELARTENQVKLQLATQSQLSSARKALTDAQATFDAQVMLGANQAAQVLRAPFDGVVTALNTGQGDRVQSGADLLQLARTDALLVSLSIDPEDAARVRTGQPVRLVSAFEPDLHVDGQVAQVQAALNGQTHLTGVLVRFSPKPGGRWQVGTRVRGEVMLGRRKEWTVPRQAVLRDEQGAYLYQVQNGKAKRVGVTIRDESGAVTGIEPIDREFDPNLPVVVEGNYELEDGMAVREGNR